MKSKTLLLISCFTIAAACGHKNGSDTPAAVPSVNTQCSGCTVGRANRQGLSAVDYREVLNNTPLFNEIQGNGWSDMRVRRAELRVSESGYFGMNLFTQDSSGFVKYERFDGVIQAKSSNTMTLARVSMIGSISFGSISTFRLSSGKLCADVDLSPSPLIGPNGQSLRAYPISFTICDKDSVSNYDDGGDYDQNDNGDRRQCDQSNYRRDQNRDRRNHDGDCDQYKHDRRY